MNCAAPGERERKEKSSGKCGNAAESRDLHHTPSPTSPTISASQRIPKSQDKQLRSVGFHSWCEIPGKYSRGSKWEFQEVQGLTVIRLLLREQLWRRGKKNWELEATNPGMKGGKSEEVSPIPSWNVGKDPGIQNPIFPDNFSQINK